MRKRGDDFLRGLAGAYATRINVIIVTSTSNSIEQYSPPANTPHTDEIWLIYLDLGHTRHYLSTTKLDNNEPRIPPPPVGGAAGNTAETRRTTASAKPLNDPAPEAGSSQTQGGLTALQTAERAGHTAEQVCKLLRDPTERILNSRFVHKRKYKISPVDQKEHFEKWKSRLAARGQHEVPGIDCVWSTFSTTLGEHNTQWCR